VGAARFAQAALARGGFDAVAAHADWRVLALDARGRGELGRLLTRWQRTVERVMRASAQRLEREPRESAHRCAATALSFELPAGVGQD
jgi:hypothetical protein